MDAGRAKRQRSLLVAQAQLANMSATIRELNDFVEYGIMPSGASRGDSMPYDAAALRAMVASGRLRGTKDGTR